jgi:hypothetical protein
MMTSCTDGSAVLYWSESTPIARPPASWAASKTPPPEPPAVVDDVGAVVEHALRRGLALGGVTEAGEVRRLGQVDRVDDDVGVDLLGTGLVAGLELLDQGHLDAADEADVARLGLQGRRRADQERALLLGEGQAGDVRDVGQAGVVDDREVDVGVLGRDLADGLGVGEAHGDDRVVAGLGEGDEALLARRLGLTVGRLGLLGVDAELVLGLVETGRSGVVERLVATPADVVGHADLDVGGGTAAARAVVLGIVAAAVTVIAARGRSKSENPDREDGCELPTASQDASLMFMGHPAADRVNGIGSPPL